MKSEITPASREKSLIGEILDAVKSLSASDLEVKGYEVDQYRDLVKTSSWTEMHCADDGQMQKVNVNGQIWSDAIQKTLDTHDNVIIPERDEPYYIDRPIVLKSDNHLIVKGKGRIILKPGSNCSMIRNKHIICGQRGEVGLQNPDTGIVVDGGIWSTLATARGELNGNLGGAIEAGGRTNDAFCTNGTFQFSNVRNVRIANVTFRECRLHGVQFSNCSQFLVENIRFEDHRRDGVHINGPADYGVVRNIRNAAGTMGDDIVALTAWDWKNTSMTFGPIHHIFVEDVNGVSANRPDSQSEIRLLAGMKNFPDKKRVDCHIENCVFHGISGIKTFKMYDQPNLELGRDNDYADPIGHMSNLYFRDIRLAAVPDEPVFQIALNIDGISIKDVVADFPLSSNNKLIRIGPGSQTYKFGKDPSKWVELFSPDSICMVKGLEISLADSTCSCPDMNTLVEVVTQKINHDYPNTTPRGGTGRGVWIKG
ncbi:MAG: hypothetical protein WAX69_23115 [Victivallales bacterium]